MDATQETPLNTNSLRRVLMVTGDFVKTGGMDMPNYAVATYLARQGVAVELVAHRIDEELKRKSSVLFHRIPKPLNSYLLGSPLLDRAGRYFARRVLATGGHTIVNGGNCQVGDVNWVHYVHAAYDPEVNTHGPRWFKERLARQQFLKEERAALGQARIVIANSELTRTHLVERVGVPSTKIRIVYYGIDPERFRPPTEEERIQARETLGFGNNPTVVFIGGLGDQRKGFDTLFGAWRTLATEPSWDANLIVVGRGAQLEKWHTLASSHGLASRIRFLGFRNDVPLILAGADALVAPTRYEAYGLGVQEALASGLPAIVSATAGVAERYPAQLRELLLVDFNSESELAQRLRYWRENSETIRGHVAGLSATLRSRSWDHMAQDVIRNMSQ